MILFVRNGALLMSTDGAVMFLKKKLKLMKSSLKEWHCQHSHNLDGRITVVKQRMSQLDSKDEVTELREDEIAKLHELSIHIHSLARLRIA